MEISSNDILHHSPPTSCNDVGNHDSPVAPDVANQGGMEYKHEIGEEEARTILEVIASTGKFWHDWDKLKRLLSFQLMQVLSEYPEAKMTSEQQSSSLGETYPELARRLDEALLSFVEGPPFTLQRLCEILLSSRSIYSNLSKLALALEKNLLVTSTLTISADPYPPSLMQKPEEIDRRGEEPQEGGEETQENAISEQNGLEQLTLDKDEVMTEVEADEMTMDVEAFEQIVGPSESNSAPTTES
ncbi:uncharacterized protein LOC131315141 [Rhododendron vialii]|uniref:uncharacterized protein LOC131315141 n=1 Tax=Rhododendron vialii TaxID=182163 RepID=UPI00265E67E6|nr:uncharacterized protein LOC131315141 [Rhododendron vialii]XP_058200206.1 uncharacterized protein LOC131315141 [Rhododendron vialii]